MIFSHKKTCNSCRGFVPEQGCVFDIAVEISGAESKPLEPCMKPVSNKDMKSLCDDSSELDVKLAKWRETVAR